MGLLCLISLLAAHSCELFTNISKGYFIDTLINTWLHHSQWSNSQVKGMGNLRWYKIPTEQRKGEPSSSFMGYILLKGCCFISWAPFQYPMRRLTVRSRKFWKPRDLYLELSDRSDIWQAPRQQGCRSACQISRRCDNLNYQSRGFETSRDLTSQGQGQVIPSHRYHGM